MLPKLIFRFNEKPTNMCTGLNTMPHAPKIHDHKEPVNVMLFDKRTFADAMKLRHSHTELGWALMQ